MKSTRSSLASRYSVAFILCLSCLMIMIASALSLSPGSSLGTPFTMAYDAKVATAPREMFAPTLVSPANPFVNTTVTATKSHTPSGNRAPGDILTYTVLITNTGAADATGVNFTDTIDPNTTLVPGSINSSPIAFNDTYSASGNIPIALSSGSGVLANDIDPDTGTNAGLTVTQVQGSAGNVGNPTNTTAAGIGGVNGSVTVLANGSFTYEPPPGFTGADTFTYQISDAAGKTGSGTVTINISNMVWFIDNTSVAANSRGTFSQPFKTIAAFNAVNTGAAPNPQNNHHVVLRPASGSYAEADGINLRDGQTLTGPAVAFNTVFTADANSSSAYNTFAASTGAAAAITATAGNGVDLGIGNALRGFNVGNTPAFFGFNGTAVGALTVATVSKTGTGGAMSVSTSGTFGSTVNFGTFESSSSASNNLNLVGVTGTLGMTSAGTGFTGSAASNAAINISGGSVSFTYAGNVTKGTTGALLSVAGGHTGTLTFNTGTLNATSGTGLQFDNADGTYNFNGTTTLNGGDAGVDISNGSSGTFTFVSTTTITSPTGTAFFVGSSPGNPIVTYSGNITQNNAARVVDIQGTTANTITFNTGTITGGASSQGVHIGDSAAVNGNVTFTTLNLGTGGSRMTNTAVTITNGGSASTINLGTVSIFTTGASAQGIASTNFDGTLNNTTGTVDSSGAPAINIDGPAGLTTLGMTLTSVTATGGTSGIIMADTNGSFLVTGDGSTTGGLFDADGTGGTITTTSSHGVSLTNCTNITLRKMNITNATLNGVFSSGGSGHTLSAVVITHPGASNIGPGGDGFGQGNGWRMENITGTNSFDQNGRVTNWQGSQSNAILLHNIGTNFTSFTMSDSKIDTSSTGAVGFWAALSGSTNGTVNLIHNEFTLIDQAGAQIFNNGSGTVTAIVQKNNFHDADATGGDGNTTLFLANDGSGIMNFTVGGPNAADGNTFKNLARLITLAGVLQVDCATTSTNGAKLNGSIQHNTLSNDAGFSNGRRSIDVQIEANGGSHGGHSVLIADNTITNNDKQGIHISTSALAGGQILNNNFTIKNNTVGTVASPVGTEGGDSGSAIEITADGDTSTGNNDLSSNILVQNNTAVNADTATVSGLDDTFEVKNRARASAGNSSTLNLTILGNTFTNNDSANDVFEVRNITDATNFICLDLDNGGASPNNAVGGNGTGFKITNDSLPAANFLIEGGTGSLAANNKSNGSAPAVITQSGTFGTSAGCANSSAIAPPEGFGIASANLSDNGQSGSGSTLLMPPGDGLDKTNVAELRQPELAWMVQAALERWRQTGISPEDLARLQQASFEVADLTGARLAEITSTGIIRVDSKAGGYGWYLDAFPMDDSNFQVLVPERELQTTDLSPANGKLDLLTVVMRELGEVYLQGKDHLPKTMRKNLAPMMQDTLTPSVRRLPLDQWKVTPATTGSIKPAAATTQASAAPSNTEPAANQAGTDNEIASTMSLPAEARYAVLNSAADRTAGRARLRPTPAMIRFNSASDASSYAAIRAKRVRSTSPFSGETVTVNGGGAGFTIPVGKTVTIMFQVTINNPFPPNVCTVTNPAPASGVNVTGSNFTSVTIAPDSATIVKAPTIGTCPTNITKNTDPNACTAVTTFTTPTSDACPAATVTCVPGSGTAFAKGTTTVTCTAANGILPNATCTFTVTVNDAQAPVLSGCTNQTINTAAGVCTATATYTPTATDNCDGSRPVTCIPASGSTFNKGVTTVSCSASDLATPTANTGTCTFTITVNDNQAPVLSGCTNQTLNTAPGVCTATATYTPTATDNCDGSRPVTCVPASGSTFNKGVTTVSCSASDLNAPPNTGTCTFTVTVVDNQAPVFAGCTNITTNTAPGLCTAAPTFTPTATDNCDGSRPVTCVPASGSTFNKGVTTVNCSASDLSSNTGNCSFTVTVNDNQAPVLSGCTNQTINAGAGACTATATYAVTATDNCDGSRPVTCVPASGSTFNRGVTTVTCSASDLNAPPNTGTCMFTITVNDTQPPVVTCPASGGAFAASDCLPSQRSAYTGATLYSVGPNTVTNAVLSNFTPCTVPPVSGMATINFTGILTGDLSLGGPPAHFQAPVNGSMKVTFNNLTGSTRTFDTEMLQLDISGGNLPAGVQLRESPTLVSTGQTKITTVTGGFRIDSFFDVFTELSTNSGGSWTPDPTARHLAAVQSTDPGACNAVVSYPDATATDNCPGVSAVACVPASGTTFSKGTTTVTCSATDAGNLTGNCSFTVTVVDTQLPTLTCPSNINVIGNVCQVQTYTTPTPSDNCSGATASCSPASGTCFAVGTTTVTCTATDSSANTNSCTFTVTVTPCTITCPSPITDNVTPGTCAKTITYAAPTTTGMCGTVSCTPVSGSSFAKGVTTVTCSTTAGPSCTFTVTINDNEAPVLAGCTNVSANTASNACSAVVNYTQPTASDVCDGTRTVTCTPTAGSTFPKGVTTVSCSASDTSNNTGMCTFTVTVTDNVAPVLSGCTNVSAFTASNACNAVVNYTQPTATDNCDGARPVVCNPAAGSTFQKGVTTVTCTASDLNVPMANTGTCMFTVTVTDNVAPVLSGCTNLSAFTASNSCMAVVTYTQPTAADNCDGARTVTCNPASGSTFNKGVTTVTCSAMDTSNNTGMCTFTVTVTDNIAPVLSGCTNVTANTASNTCNAVVNYTQPTANDNCDGARTVTCSPTAGSVFPKGVTTVSCSASDTSNNTGNCTFTVTVTDNVAPVLSGCTNLTANTASNSCTAVVSYTQPTANDNCDGARTVTCNPASGSMFNKGVTTVSCSATDTSNNTGTCTFTVTVSDATPPVITCPANVTKDTDPNMCNAVVTYSAPTVSDNCPGLGAPVCTPASGSTFQKGVTTVTCTVSDSSKNSANCSFTVKVDDTQKPKVDCPADMTVTTPNDNDLCTMVTYPAPMVSDNCPGVGAPVCTPPSMTFCFPVGMTTVTCTATDTSGNTGQCTFKITVQNPCTITCPPNQVRSNDPNQCGAVVNYPPPTSTGTCGTITCTPASGSFFPVGITDVTCQAATGGGGPLPRGKDAPTACSTITESTSQAITPLNSVSCNNGIGHTDNSYYRAFTLSSFGISGAWDIQSVDIGVELASAGVAAPSVGGKIGFSKSSGQGSGGVKAPNATQPITVKLYTSSMPFPTGFPGSLTLIGQTDTTVADQALTIINVPVTGTAPAGSQLVVEVFTPDGEAAGNLFFIGSNASPETGPSYLRAPACGVTNPTTTAALGFPNMHIVMNVNGCDHPVGTGRTCTFTVTVNDTQPPTITCPANIFVAAAASCPPATSRTVNYTVTATDNCPDGVTVVCNPPSGSIFPVGTSTVNCTATDAHGNTATCSFTVTVFSSCLVDESNPSNVVLFNTLTGEYRFCCNGQPLASGTGVLTMRGCIGSIDDQKGSRKVTIGFDFSAFGVGRGTASLFLNGPTELKCKITDQNMSNNSCTCP